MNVKNLNPLERHVEKIVLAVAAAGAIFIGYLAIQPITIPDSDVKAVDVEPKVTTAVEELDAKRAAVAALKDLTPPLKRYDQDYINTVGGEPVPQKLLVDAVPQFGPKNVPVERYSNELRTVNNGYQVVTPTVPAPTDMTTKGYLFVVNDPTGVDATGAPLPPAAVPTTHNITLVDVSGFIPMGAFLAQMNDPMLKPPQLLPVDQRRGIVYRIEVQRRQRKEGQWSAYTPVTPSKVGGDLPVEDWDNMTDANVPTAFNDIDTAFKKIVEPDFYTLPSGQTFIPASLVKFKALPVPVVPGVPGVRPGATTPPPAPAIVQPDDSESPGAPAASLTPDVVAMKAAPKIPFWFYDETALGGQEYQYEARIVMVNPTFHSQFGLQNPAMAKTALLSSPWTVVASPITVPSEEYFFVSNTLGNNKNVQRANVKIFKWLNGKWYNHEAPIDLGAPVAAKWNDLTVVPPIQFDVKTGFTLVDVDALGGDTLAILLNQNGELVKRSANTDVKTDLYAELVGFTTVKRPPPAPTTLPSSSGSTDNPNPTPPTRGPSPFAPVPIQNRE